jgi:hypothetical protein
VLEAKAVLPSQVAIPAFMARSDMGTTRRESGVESNFLMALHGEFEIEVPLARQGLAASEGGSHTVTATLRTAGRQAIKPRLERRLV